MRIYQIPGEMLDALRAVFHPKDRHLYLADDLWILSQKVAWETAVSKFQMLPGLVGFWPMGSVQRSTGNIYDLSGQGRTLTRNGGVEYNLYNDFAPYADFNGSTGYLSRSDETDLDILGTETIYAAAMRGLTIGGWFWFDDAPGAFEHIISKWPSGLGQRSYRIFRTLSGAIEFQVSNDGSATISVTSTVITTASQWFFILARYIPGTKLSIFVQAAETINTTSIPASIFSGTADFTISSLSGGGVLFMDGRASLCFLCANALPDALINQLYNQSRRLFGVGS